MNNNNNSNSIFKILTAVFAVIICILCVLLVMVFNHKTNHNDTEEAYIESSTSSDSSDSTATEITGNEVQSPNNDIQTLDSEIDTSLVDNTELYNVYKTAVETMYINYGYNIKYGLFDIDGNSVQELIFETGHWTYHVYTYDNGILVNCGEIDSKYGLHHSGDALYGSNGGTGYSEYSIIKLNDSLKVQQSVFSYLEREETLGVTDYRLNGESISESEYYSIYYSIFNLELYPNNDLSLLDKLL